MKNNHNAALKQRMKDEAIYALTQKPIITYSADRVRVWHEACKTVHGFDTQPAKFANALRYFLEHISIPVEDGDILIGRMEEESFTEEEEAAFREKYLSDGELTYYGVPPFDRDGGHCSLLWEQVFEKGIPGLKKEAEGWLGVYEEKGMESQCEYLKNAILIYDSLLLYFKRNEEICRARGMEKQAEIFAQIKAGAPDSFRAAMQLLWTITFVYCAYIAPNPTIALGRPDLFLNDLYEKDKKEGRITKEEASLLIADFYAKNNLLMGRGEHQISGRHDESTCTGWHRILCFDAPQYMILSGADPRTGETVANELTKLFIEEIVPSYKNPVIVFRYTKDFAQKHPEMWKTLLKRLRDSASAMIYNDISLLKMYQDKGLDPVEARTYEFFGCNHPTLPARDKMAYEFEGDISAIMNQAVHAFAEKEEVFDRKTFYQYIYKAYCDFYLELAGKVNVTEKEHKADSQDLRFYSCFASENMKNAGLYYETTNVLVNIGHICSAIDMACAMEYLCLEKGMDPKCLMEICDRDFEGEPSVLALCKKAPKAGDGEPLSSLYVKEITELIIAAAEDGLRDIPAHCRVLFVAEQDTWHIEHGAAMGATCDGRRKGAPVSQNCQPAFGACKNGVTAMLSSLNQMPFDKMAAGAINLTIDPGTFAGDEGIAKFGTLLEVYFERGGMQLQISGVDREKLLAAQKDPDSYRDLMVRITGYSAGFVDLGAKAQEDILARDGM